MRRLISLGSQEEEAYITRLEKEELRRTTEFSRGFKGTSSPPHLLRLILGVLPPVCVKEVYFPQELIQFSSLGHFIAARVYTSRSMKMQSGHETLLADGKMREKWSVFAMMIVFFFILHL